MNGKLVTKDSKKALDLWADAAQKGHVDALHNVGLALYKGDGTEKNEISAYASFMVSKMLGNKKSIKGIRYLKTKLKEIEIAEGEALAMAMWCRIMKEKNKGDPELSNFDYEMQYFINKTALNL